MNRYQKDKKYKGGYTILETIVAITIISGIIAGVFGVIQQSLAQSIGAKEEVTAYNLAQEAIEVIRGLKDGNQLNKIINTSGSFWLQGISENGSDPCYFGKVCYVDAQNFSLHDCNSSNWGNCPFLRLDTASALYGYNNSWPETGFKREVKLEQITAREIVVIVRITWSRGLLTKTFEARANIFNWI